MSPAGDIPGVLPARRPDADRPPPVTALTTAELVTRIEAHARPRFHAGQIRRAIFQRHVDDFDAMTDLPLDLRRILAGELRVLSSEVELVRRSNDGTKKLLVRLEDGARVETVIIPEGKRVTVCVSSEVGCQVRCTFCASGLEGLGRPLGGWEIVEQVLHVRALLEREGPGPLTNLVLMGMGEPLLNYDAVLEALRVLRDPDAVGLGSRRITLSTVGIVEAMDRLAAEDLGIGLAVSLHAPDDETRSDIVPLNRRWGVDAIVDAARRYARDTRRDVTFEYVLLAGVNDSPAQARRLAEHAAGAHIHVNLLPFNPVAGLPYRAPGADAVERFAGILRRGGVPVTVRRQRGEDIDAACGQLRRRQEQADANGGIEAGPAPPASGSPGP